MIRRIIIILCYIFLLSSILISVNNDEFKLGPFSSIPEIFVQGDYLYAWDTSSTRFYIYSITKKKLIKNLLKKGEGPGEIKAPGESIERINVLKNNLYMYTNGKMMVFTHSGEFLYEKRFPFNIRKAIKCGETFIGEKYITNKKGTLYNSLNIYDSNFKLVKTIYKQRKYNPMKHIEFMLSKLFFICYKNNIYVADNNKKLNIFKYDLKGNRVGEIKISYKRYIITSKDKRYLIKQYINNGDKCTPVFHKYFPAFREIIFYNDKIYIQLYKSSKTGKNEFIVYDIKTGIKTKIFLPFCINYVFYEDIYYCIKISKNGEFYVMSGNLN